MVKAMNLMDNQPPMVVRLMDDAAASTFVTNSSNATATPTTTSESLDDNWVAVYASIGVVSGIGLIAIIVASIKFCQCGREGRNSGRKSGRNTYRFTIGRTKKSENLESVDYLQHFKQKQAHRPCKKISIFSGRKSGKTRQDVGRLTLTGIAKPRDSSRGSKNAHYAPKDQAFMHDFVIEDRKETLKSEVTSRGQESLKSVVTSRGQETLKSKVTSRGQLRNQPRVMDHRQEKIEWQHNDNNRDNGSPVPETILDEENHRNDGQEDDNDPINETNENQSNDENGDSDEQDDRNEGYDGRGMNRMNDCDGNGSMDVNDSEMTISWSDDETDIEENDEDGDENKFLDSD